MTSVKDSVLHTVGKIRKGFTCVASDTDLNAVSIIHKKGTSIVIDIRTNTICMITEINFLLASIPVPPFNYSKPIFSVRSSGIL